jgi:hypothetical protein
VHLKLNLNISSPYLIKFHDFEDNSQEGMKHQMTDATQAPQGMTLWITLLLWHYSILHFDYHPQFQRNPGFISEFFRLY